MNEEGEKYTIHNGSLYDYANGNSCGVLIKENVMKKLAKLQQQHLEATKRVLMDEADIGNVFPSMWTLHHPDGKQTNVSFIDQSADLESRINNAVIMNKPSHKPLVFIASSMDDAKDMADARYAELNYDGGEK